ncbi:hypothetical protein QJQ45_020394 [Haematococcus lacustris]|nr:hypothetical protein QJQ45_020394 [Haematococcus lacustris]
MAENKKKLLDGLKSVIWQTCELEETVTHLDNPAVLHERLQNYEKSLLGLVQLTPALAGVRVPVEMLQYVDQGGNPHQYTAEVFEACVRDNQLVKGKVVAVQSLYDALLAELTTQQPEVAAAYSLAAAAQGSGGQQAAWVSTAVQMRYQRDGQQEVAADCATGISSSRQARQPASFASVSDSQSSLRRPLTRDSLHVMAQPLAAATSTRPMRIRSPTEVEPAVYPVVRLRSVSSVVECIIEFVNTSDVSVWAVWLDFAGNEVQYTMIEAKGKRRYRTFQSHPWIVRAVHNGQRMMLDRRMVVIGRGGEQSVKITTPPQLLWSVLHIIQLMAPADVPQCVSWGKASGCPDVHPALLITDPATWPSQAAPQEEADAAAVDAAAAQAPANGA